MAYGPSREAADLVQARLHGLVDRGGLVGGHGDRVQQLQERRVSTRRLKGKRELAKIPIPAGHIFVIG